MAFPITLTNSAMGLCDVRAWRAWGLLSFAPRPHKNAHSIVNRSTSITCCQGLLPFEPPSGAPSSDSPQGTCGGPLDPLSTLSGRIVLPVAGRITLQLARLADGRAKNTGGRGQGWLGPQKPASR